MKNRGPYDVAILTGTTPFVIKCQEAAAYKQWEGSLRHAVQEYKTWSSFRRNENVMEYYKGHVGEKVRFLKGIEGARNDQEAVWEEMGEVEIMKISKETFQSIEKSSRKVEAWHGVAEETIIRTDHDVAFLAHDNACTFAAECRALESFALFEEVIRKALIKYNKSWEAFRRSGGINCFFWNELGQERRLLRARNENATSDDDADWEVLCGEPLTSFMEKKFQYYACVFEVPDSPIKKEQVKEAATAVAPGSMDVELTPEQEEVDSTTEAPKEEKKRKSKLDDDSDQQSRKQAKDGSKDSALAYALVSRDNFDDPNVENLERQPAMPPNKKLVCSIFVLSKSLALTLGRIDAKVKTKWKLGRLRQEIDPVLRQKNFLTLGVAWEFYFYDSGSFVSQAFEEHLSIADYLMEANQENAISIRVIP